MSEDKIIEECKRIIFEYGWIRESVDGKNEDLRALGGLLDLYQKEKEKNKDIAKDLNKYKKECYLQGKEDENKAMLGVIQRHYISKDKIRKKIKELYDIKDVESVEGSIEDIKLLKELLEENNGE